ncbi:MAG TPA: citrate/2-methylcitrate synthase [Fibrobacteria bacterium]|nr:citrate/2-methylcitrate synthase [Fibrobacteria bacterium]
MGAPGGAAPPEAPPAYMQSRIWREEPEADNPFAARAAYCHGYDIYGDMLGHAGWADMIYLLFRGEAPSPSQAEALELLAVALANPGPREASVHAAMCGGVGGSPAAASLMAALAVGAGSLGGAREVFLAMEAWAECGRNVGAWEKRWADPAPEQVGVWPGAEHPAGFDPHGVTASTPVRQVLDGLSGLDPASHAAWLRANRPALEKAAGHPLSLVAAAAAAFVDLGFSPAEGEMLFLLMRLPGAAAHALEQRGLGHKRFPFYRLDLQDGPREKRP